MNRFPIIFSLLIGISFVISGCAGSAGSYQPIVDGPKEARYSSDLASCQNLSKERTYINADTKSEAAAGALIGAITGALDDGSDGAIEGAIIGSLASGGARAWDVRNEKKAIIIKCMTNRGHKVVG